MQITPYGGVNEIEGNTIIVEIGKTKSLSLNQSKIAEDGYFQ